MIRELGDLLLRVRFPYQDAVTIQRARSLLVIAWVALIATLIILPLAVVGAVGQGNVGVTEAVLPFISIPIMLAAIIFLIQIGRYNIAVWVYLIVSMLSIGYIGTIDPNPYSPYNLVLTMIVAGLLLTRRGFIVAAVLLLTVLGFRVISLTQFTEPMTVIPATNAVNEFVTYLVAFGASSLFLLVFIGGTERITREATRDVEKLRATNRLIERITREMDELDILREALNLLRDEFNYETVDFFLSDRAGGIERPLRGGARLRGSDHRVIERAMETRAPVVVTAIDVEHIDHLVPPATASLTLPLFDGSSVIGALDVQTADAPGFSQNDIEAVNGIVNVVARAITEHRMTRNLTLTIREQEETIRRSLTQIADLRQRSQAFTDSSWQRYLQGRGAQSMGYDVDAADDGMLISAADLPDEIRHAIAQGNIHTERHGDEQIVSVPIMVRQQALGAVAFTFPADRVVTERQLDLLRTVTSRLGLALENNRLFEQTQAQAQRERRASEISATLLGATDVENVLSLAADRFNEALGAVRTRISIEPGAIVDGKSQTAPLKPSQDDGL